MAHIRLSTITGVSAILAVVGFVLGIVLMASSGVQVLIPDSGDEVAWMADAHDGGELFVAGAWIAVAAGLVGIVALVGLYDVLKSAGPYLVFARRSRSPASRWSRSRTSCRSRSRRRSPPHSWTAALQSSPPRYSTRRR
jgi:hypothetical protein